MEGSHCHLSASNLWWHLWMEMVEVAAKSVFSQGLWKNEAEERLKIRIVVTQCVGESRGLWDKV